MAALSLIFGGQWQPDRLTSIHWSIIDSIIANGLIDGLKHDLMLGPGRFYHFWREWGWLHVIKSVPRTLVIPFEH